MLVAIAAFTCVLITWREWGPDASGFQPEHVVQESRVFLPGDRLEWALPERIENAVAYSMDDFLPVLNETPGPWWIRQDIILTRSVERVDQPHSICVETNRDIEVFWNGGKISTPLPSTGTHAAFPRRFIQLIFPPGSLQNGSHLLAIRVPNETRSVEPDIQLAIHAANTFVPKDSWRYSETEFAPAAPGSSSESTAWIPAEPAGFLFSAHQAGDVPARVYWLQTRMVVTDHSTIHEPHLLFESIKGAREIHWDGQLIGQSGQVASDAVPEVPGLARAWHPIPSDLFTPGAHVINVRVSSDFPHARHEGVIDDFEVWPQSRSVDFIVGAISANHLQLGVTAVAAILFTLLFVISDRRAAYLAFALCCWGATLALTAGTIWAHTFQTLRYPDERWLVFMTIAGNSAAAFMLVVFASYQLELKQRRRTWLITAIVFAVIAWMSPPGPTVGRNLILGASGISALLYGWRSWANDTSALILLSGVVLLGFSALNEAVQTWGIVALIASVLGVLGREYRQERIARTRAQLHAIKLSAERNRLAALKSRAEAELLKTSIQPHFLINTLTALIEWVEHDPSGGVRFIRAIEKHFDLLLRCASKKLVPINEELQLSRAFLDIMGFRKLVSYELQTDGVDSSIQVPPLVLHTLIENGVTHCQAGAKTVEFQLFAERQNHRHSFRLITPYEPAETVDANRPRRGTGLSYARARLEECYPGDWELTSSPSGGQWITHLCIPACVKQDESTP